MRILVNNLANNDNSSMSDESSAFPLSNLTSNILVEKTLISSTIDIDFGSARNVTAIGIVDEGLSLRINAGTFAGDVSFSYDTDSSINTEVNFIDETYQYWQIELLGALVNVPPALVSPGDVFTDPTIGSFEQNDVFLPMYESLTPGVDTGLGFPIGVSFGGVLWQQLYIGENSILEGATSGGTTLNFDLTQGGTTGWNVFATEPNGLYKMWFPGLANNDKGGGFHEFYYNMTAYQYAFENTFNQCIPATNGSVYINSISNSNLVVRWDGMVGPAGSATPDVTVDIDRPMPIGAITPSLLNYLYLGEYLQLPGIETFSTPELNDTDAIAITSGHQIHTTLGSFFQTQTFNVIGSTQDEYEAFLNWYKSSDRKNNHLISQFEEDLDCTPFEPWFAKLSASFNQRIYLSFDYELTAEEAK